MPRTRPRVRSVDVLIIGSGAGGAALAWSLGARGLRVVVLEKGPRYARHQYLHDEIAMEDASGFFLPRLEEDPHVVVRDGTPPERSSLGWTASCVGGGTVHMGASLYRFSASDFRARSTFGECEQVVDWPYSYDALAPYYSVAEQQLGVSGGSRSHPFLGIRPLPYPMPPLQSHPLAAELDRASAALGLRAFHTPRAINSVPYGGRPACGYCDFCAGFGCPTGARGTAQETLLAAAERTADTEVLERCFAIEVTLNAAGRAAGCVYFDDRDLEHSIDARVVCVCCSAVESARLLLLSRSRCFPDGLANGSGCVGQHLQFHSVSSGAGRFGYTRHALQRSDHNHFLNRSLADYYAVEPPTLPYAKGGLLRFDLARPLPIARAQQAIRERSSTSLWGDALKEAIRTPFRDHCEVEFEVFHDFLPNSRTFVTLDPDVRDRWRLPVARIQLGTVPHHATAGQWLVERGLDVLRGMRADSVAATGSGGVSRAMVHGTCRAGVDPSTSVLDPFCQSHEVPNLFVVDGSFMPTSGGAPSTLTIAANALRTADRIAELGRRGEL